MERGTKEGEVDRIPPLPKESQDDILCWLEIGGQ